MALNYNMKLILLLLFLLFISITACTMDVDVEESDDFNEEVEKERIINIDKLEIFHFHGTTQCYSCITMGDYAEETVNTYFKDELESGLIVFDHIDGQLSENRELVIKYGATGSSLWLGTYDGDDFSAEQNTKVWYKLRDKEGYMNYLKGVIEEKLAGN
ncbi:MAG: nitrophenyl compound nitroreductase subunit ArsF family protein [Candidatus Woesearchaeota archaeon]